MHTHASPHLNSLPKKILQQPWQILNDLFKQCSLVMNGAILQPCANTELLGSKQASFSSSRALSNTRRWHRQLLLSHLEGTLGIEEPSMLNSIWSYQHLRNIRHNSWDAAVIYSFSCTDKLSYPLLLLLRALLVLSSPMLSHWRPLSFLCSSLMPRTWLQLRLFK